jgi:toxin ParE1/3/4
VAREIHYLASGQQDLLDAIEWIAADSKARALKWRDEIDARITALATTPDLGRKPRNRRIQDLGYRILILGDYLVFYKYAESRIVIHRVLHGSRSYLALL